MTDANGSGCFWASPTEPVISKLWEKTANGNKKIQVKSAFISQRCKKVFGGCFQHFFFFPKLGKCSLKFLLPKKIKKWIRCAILARLFRFYFTFLSNYSKYFSKNWSFPHSVPIRNLLSKSWIFPAFTLWMSGTGPISKQKKFFHGWFIKWLPLLGVTFFLFLRSFYFFSNIFP